MENDCRVTRVGAGRPMRTDLKQVEDLDRSIAHENDEMWLESRDMKDVESIVPGVNGLWEMGCSEGRVTFILLAGPLDKAGSI